jgi:hypothetical protein
MMQQRAIAQKARQQLSDEEGSRAALQIANNDYKQLLVTMSAEREELVNRSQSHQANVRLTNV